MFKKLGSFISETLQVLIFAISIFLFIYLLVLQPHKIKGASMEPNFHDGEYLLTDKITYRLGEPKRGDVIVFKAPPEKQDEFIKRIIGLPGDTVSLIEGSLYLNGQPFEENYLPSNFITNPGKFAQENIEITVPSDQYFVLGDNRDHSLDSRTFGFVSKDTITGRAWVIYWPVTEFGVIQNPLHQ